MPKLIKNLNQKIYDEAKALLISNGFESFNMRDLAKKCNIALGTLYNYYSSKDALAMEIFNSDWDNVLEIVTEIGEKNCTLMEKLSATYDVLESYIKNYMHIFIEMADENSSKCQSINAFEKIHPIMCKWFEPHILNGDVKTTLETERFVEIITSILITGIKKKYTFQELSQCLLVCNK